MSASTSTKIGDGGGGFAFVDFDGQSVFDLDRVLDMVPSENHARCYLIAGVGRGIDEDCTSAS